MKIWDQYEFYLHAFKKRFYVEKYRNWLLKQSFPEIVGTQIHVGEKKSETRPKFFLAKKCVQ